jgi:predicted metal-binding protein
VDLAVDVPVDLAMDGPVDTDPDIAVDAASARAVTVLVCSSCRRPGDGPETPRPGTRLADALAIETSPGVSVRRVACLGNCTRGLSAAIYREGCWTYVFGGLDEGSSGDLLEGARLFAGASDGFMPWRGRPEALKRGLIARVPPIDLLKDLP